MGETRKHLIHIDLKASTTRKLDLNISIENGALNLKIIKSYVRKKSSINKLKKFPLSTTGLRQKIQASN